MADQFRIERSGVCIDAAHRVPLHGSRCKNIHGHRYEIIAACQGTLADGTEEDGMVMDFGFLKEEMMFIVDACADHGLILSASDPLLTVLTEDAHRWGPDSLEDHSSYHILTDVKSSGVFIGKIYIIKTAPTAENLARHWYLRLSERVLKRTDGRARLISLSVAETPNCVATYPIEKAA
jgi:6-pyruvoyltetrahydropterin/6-carboxytetrahydropterin synthase